MSIHEVRAKYEEGLLRLPNVVGVSIGEKAGKPVIQVHVTHKVPEADLRPEEIIPKTLEGSPVDVHEIGVVTAQRQAFR